MATPPPPTGSSTGGGGGTGGGTGGDWPTKLSPDHHAVKKKRPNVRVAANNLPVEFAILFSIRAIVLKQFAI